jgi:hypothetical protein
VKEHREREAKPVGAAADGSASSSASTLDLNPLLVEEEDDDSEGAGEGADDWQSTDVNGLLSWDWEVTTVERQATAVRRKRSRPWRWLDREDAIGGVLTSEEIES